MTEGNKPAALKKAERAEWKQPVIRRMEAGQAELGLVMGGDAGNQAIS